MSLILVDGIDGSGKTRLADRLARVLREAGGQLTLLHVDDYRRTVNWSDPRGELELYWQEYFDLAALDADIGEHQSAGHLVLVEGIFTCRLAAAATGALIYLEVDFAAWYARVRPRYVVMDKRPDVPAPMARLQPQVHQMRSLTVLQFW